MTIAAYASLCVGGFLVDLMWSNVINEFAQPVFLSKPGDVQGATLTRSEFDNQNVSHDVKLGDWLNWKGKGKQNGYISGGIISILNCLAKQQDAVYFRLFENL